MPDNHQRLLDGIEDYLFIGGNRLSNRQAAERLGVHPRTITRWRAFMRHPERPSCGWSACPDPSAHTHVRTRLMHDSPPRGGVHQIAPDLSLACGANGPGALGSSDPADVTCAACSASAA